MIWLYSVAAFGVLLVVYAVVQIASEDEEHSDNSLALLNTLADWLAAILFTTFCVGIIFVIHSLAT